MVNYYNSVYNGVCDYAELRKKNAKKYIDFYWEHRGDIYIANLTLSYEGNDLLIDLIQ